VYSTTTVRDRAGDYNVAIVELEGGARMMSRVDGVAPDAVRIRAARAISCALERAAKAAVPGARCEDIAKACLSEIRQHGFERSGRVGYSTGLGFPPDWGEHTLSLRAGDRTEVQAGMTIFMIPALWGDLWSVGIGETILVTEHGGISLTDIGFDLIVND